MIRLFTLILLFFLGLHSQSQTRLKIIDAESSESIIGATFSFQNAVIGITDSLGSFSCNDYLGDSIWISHVNYESALSLFDGLNTIIRLKRKSTRLNEVVVSSMVKALPRNNVAGSVAVINKTTLSSLNESSVLASMNSIPGVRMEQRSPGSYRINIRGSSLRAPFDVRNVKVYWNDIPLTEPGGNTAFNILDPGNFDKIEVIKGPVASIYGAGLGGTIISENKAKKANQIGTSWQFGSYGHMRSAMSLNLAGKRSKSLLNYVNEQSDGYRDHSNFRRESMQWSTSHNLSTKGLISGNLLYTKLDYEIPGGLNAEQYAINARQARDGSIEKNASIDVENILVGLSYDYNWCKNLKSRNTIYGVFTNFKNPFIFDYKKENQKGVGGRSTLEFSGTVASNEINIVVGIEYQYRFSSAKNFQNEMGSMGSLNFDDEIKTRQALAFVQSTIELPFQISMSLGFSANSIIYNINRLEDVQLARDRLFSRDFDTVISPRLSIVKRIKSTMSVYANISHGFSTPTLEEVRTNEGSVNLDLSPEQGVNYEFGFNGRIPVIKTDVDLTLFQFNLSQAIVDFTDNRGTDLFRNSGGLYQKGIELSLTQRFIDDPKKTLSGLKLQTALTINSFKFREYIIKANDFSGNHLPGVANIVSVSTLILNLKNGFYTNAYFNFTDKIPLNNDNTLFADSYHLLSFKLGYKRYLGKRFEIDLFYGLNNALNEKYSLGNDLNAFGERYYQVSPNRNFYSGLKLKYLI